jgi:hypothetical protein
VSSDAKEEKKDGKIPVRIVGTGREFDSLEACARYLRVSPPTVARLMRADEPIGDIRIERVEE